MIDPNFQDIREELKRISIEDAPFVTRKIWYCLIETLRRLDKLEIEFEKLRENR